VAGVFIAPNLGLGTNLMQLTLIFGFAAITLGGFDSLVGAVVGGFVVGALSSVMPRYITIFEKMPLAPAFILILAVLLFRPEGLFGKKQVTRV
jgi:branched-chain amino acid transport system permease protein